MRAPFIFCCTFNRNFIFFILPRHRIQFTQLKTILCLFALDAFIFICEAKVFVYASLRVLTVLNRLMLHFHRNPKRETTRKYARTHNWVIKTSISWEFTVQRTLNHRKTMNKCNQIPNPALHFISWIKAKVWDDNKKREI